MKGHRSRGKAARVVVPRYGRTVRLSGGEKRKRRLARLEKAIDWQKWYAR